MSEVTTGYAPVNGIHMYWRSVGTGGTPLVVLHGGFGVADMFGDVLDQLAASRQVVAVELRGHGHTRDDDRPFSYESFADDVAALVAHLGLGRVDLLGYSLGGGTALWTTFRHPEIVRRLVVVSVPHAHEAWFPGVRAAMQHVGRGGFDMMKQSPVYAAYEAVAPDVDAFPALMDKTGALIQTPYDWSEQIRGIAVPTLLVYGDSDSIPPSAAAHFYELLGGGLVDAGWDGSLPSEHRLAILPGRTHYDVYASPALGEVTAAFLS